MTGTVSAAGHAVDYPPGNDAVPLQNSSLVLPEL